LSRGKTYEPDPGRGAELSNTAPQKHCQPSERLGFELLQVPPSLQHDKQNSLFTNTKLLSKSKTHKHGVIIYKYTTKIQSSLAINTIHR
jgi:hypothetical protein